jgi:hypothetical protein
MSETQSQPSRRADISQPIRTWNSRPPAVGGVAVHVGISEDRRKIKAGETFPLFYKRGSDPISEDADTECLALEVRSGRWDELDLVVPPDWLAVEIGPTAQTIDGLREALAIYYKSALSDTRGRHGDKV